MSASRPTTAQTLSRTKKHTERPNIHITSPTGWLNDPCAPGYDPNTGSYHLFYQCNPHGVEWGSMSWGHATSKDLVTWTYAPVHTILEPDKLYDKAGVFTGCLGPIINNGELSIFYSSITQLPFHWTHPAPRGTAGLALATSTDGGATWTKSKSNPILQEEPQDLSVTGFRDPYLADWPSMDCLRGEKSIYGLISGGIRGEGPSTFLYAVDPQNVKKWEYLGPLIVMPPGFLPSRKWNCSYGLNWECVNFMTLTAESLKREFLILGSEGDIAREHLHERSLSPNVPPRAVRAQQWVAGDLRKDGDEVTMAYRYGGILDHGVFYAANSFEDSISGRRIVYGWIPEEDCSKQYIHEKGWNGCQAFPREVFLQTIPRVTGALRSSLNVITSTEQVLESDGSTTLCTLGIRPIREIERLREKAMSWYYSDYGLSPRSDGTNACHLTRTTTPTWELKASIAIDPKVCRQVGFHVRHSPDFSTRTTVSFTPQDETITVVRVHSSPGHTEFNLCDEKGPFTLFESRLTPNAPKTFENLEIHIISDGDVLEIFANDRFALTTMVYTGEYEVAGGITAFAEGAVGCAIVERVDIWDGLNGGESCINHEGEDDTDENKDQTS